MNRADELRPFLIRIEQESVYAHGSGTVQAERDLEAAKDALVAKVERMMHRQAADVAAACALGKRIEMGGEA